MLKSMGSIAILLFLSVAARGGEEPLSADQFWPQWRGPAMNGVAPHGDPPTEWSETENLAWKTEIPGKGSASPIIWGERIYVLSAIPVGEPTAETPEEDPSAGRRSPPNIESSQAQQFTILAIDRRDGSLAWRKVLREEVPHEGTHATASWASNSPITDGEHIYAYFGSRGLYCLDMDGDLVWEKDLGDMQTRRGFGEGSSPALHRETLVVNWDHEGDSFIVALDKRTGAEIWRRERDEVTSWSTPLVVEHGDRPQVVVSATDRVRAYDLASGEIVWEVGGMTVNVIPTPVHAAGIVVATSGFRGNALVAVRLEGASGDLTGSESIVWSLDRDTPYTPSPLLYEGQLYFMKTNDAILSSYDLGTGEKHFGPVRVEGLSNIYSSPVGAGGRVYVAGRDGSVAVLEHGPDYKLLTVNQLDDGFDASPAIVGQELYLRGRKYLYKIAAE